MFFLFICLIIRIDTFNEKYRYKGKRPSDLSSVTFYYKENNQELLTDIPNIFINFNTTKIIVENSFVFSRHLLDYKTIGVHKLYCISDSTFSEDSAQICTRKDMLEQYPGSILFTIDVKVSKIGKFYINIIHINRNPTDFIDVLKIYFEVDYPLSSQTIVMSIREVTSRLILDNSILVSGHYNRFYPFVSWFGYSLLKPVFYDFNQSSIFYYIPSLYKIRFVDIRRFDDIDFHRTIKFYICWGLATICVYLIFFLFFQILSSDICKFLKEFYFQPEISLYTLFFSISLIFDILAGSDALVFFKEISPYFMLFTSISVINKFTLYNFSVFMISVSEMRKKKNNVGRSILIKNYLSVFLTLCTFFSCALISKNNSGKNTKTSFSINESLLKSCVFPTIMIYTFVNIIFTIMALIPAVYFISFNIRIYKTSNNIVRSNLKSRLISIFVSFFCVVTLTACVIFYIISAKELWLKQSFLYLLISYFFFAIFLSALVIGFNREINCIFLRYLRSLYNRKFKFKFFQISNNSSKSSKDSGIYMGKNFPKQSSLKNNLSSMNYFGYIDSYFDRPPVFKNSTHNYPDGIQISNNMASINILESQILKPIWKSSGFATFYEQSSNRNINSCLNQSVNIYRLSEQDISKQIIKTFNEKNESENKAILSSTPTIIDKLETVSSDLVLKSHKKYRKTPIRENLYRDYIPSEINFSIDFTENSH